MLKRKTVIALISVFTAFLIISCGGGGGGETAGVGGPEISPDNISEAVTDSAGATISLTTSVADSTTNDKLTGITDTSGEVVVEPEAIVTTEGEIDTGTDTDTTTASGETDNPGVDTNNSVTNTTDSSTAKDDAIAILTGSAGTSEEGTVEEETTDADTDAISDEAISGAAEGIASSGAGNTVEDLENDEEPAQGNLSYSIDSSAGKWYEVAEKEIISSSEHASIKAQIEQLRKEIKAARDEYKSIEKSLKDADSTPPGLAKKEKAGNSDELKAKLDEYASKITSLRKRIAELRASIGHGGSKTGGIVTYWAKQNLFLNVKGGQPGWYRLVIVAKNQGVLPDDYDRFSFSIESGNDSIASVSVKASDKTYNRGSAIFKLDRPAGTQLNILWTNDAYLKDKYDANVNIKKIRLVKIKEPVQKAGKVKRLKGDQYSVVDGRWFFDKHEAYTFWADQVIGYTFKNMEEGQYEVTVEATNHGTLPLPKNYREFLVEVDSEYDSATVAIPADEKHYKKAKFTLNFPEGDSTVYFTWVNDSYKENSYDANIKIKSIKVKKIKQSNLTAYLLKTKPGNRVFILSAFLMISAVLLGIYMKNRKSEASTL